MRNLISRLLVFCAFVALTAALVLVFAPAHTQAQEMTDMGVACDSTLATLLLVAERDYGYLSSMMMSEDAAMMPHLDFGQYTPLIESTIGMNAMMAEEMSEEDMMMMEEANTMMMEMMAMSDTDLINSYLTDMGMDAVDPAMVTTLAPGNVDGQDATCATVRASVQQFLLTHLIYDMNMAMMEASQ
jgi:hypothetical protein